MYKSTVDITKCTEEEINKELVRAYIIGKEDGVHKERSKKAIKTYICKGCGRVATHLFDNGLSSCCFKFEEHKLHLIVEQEKIEGMASSMSKEKRVSFSDEVLAVRKRSRAAKARKKGVVCDDQ